ncbi:hypothetical protein H0B56_15820 [Haloechinothrix sp. YIM 98757]|uniref:Uncharacterized protein n=1 Tax=Haloechinothrix aidingensis TaxID=2752311 RepID=A0A838ACZ1_9PSEU|nr:hypothetical protein [Haloechinothrix aidingensis]MBA0127018.1 hypothetical protein [Haloechinothrix aidingensis]
MNEQDDFVYSASDDVAQTDEFISEFGTASDLTLGIAGPHSEAGVPQRSHV